MSIAPEGDLVETPAFRRDRNSYKLRDFYIRYQDFRRGSTRRCQDHAVDRPVDHLWICPAPARGVTHDCEKNQDRQEA
jgi:hypothetical protein